MHCNSFSCHLYRPRGEQLYSTEQPSTSGLKLQCAPFQSQHSRRQGQLQLVRTYAQAPGVLQKLGRVLKEKAGEDFQRVFQGTSKTREKLGVVEELLAYWKLEDADDTLEELEEVLIASNFGPRASLRIVDSIRDEVRAGKINTPGDIRQQLKAAIISVLQPPSSSELNLGGSKTSVILVIGVNGGGKTTTIGKLAYKLGTDGAKIMLVAGDTFRAAAADQLEGWANRSGASIQRPQSDKQRPDAVMAAALDTALREGTDVVICDTSGRLHTNYKLMEELAKCHRAIQKKLKGAPHEVLLVLDGTTGLNMTNQAREFNDMVPLSGLVLTKLDGTARGGAVVEVVDELKVPIKFVGVGESVDDLQPFNAVSFVEGLFPEAV